MSWNKGDTLVAKTDLYISGAGVFAKNPNIVKGNSVEFIEYSISNAYKVKVRYTCQCGCMGMPLLEDEFDMSHFDLKTQIINLTMYSRGDVVYGVVNYGWIKVGDQYIVEHDDGSGIIVVKEPNSKALISTDKSNISYMNQAFPLPTGQLNLFNRNPSFTSAVKMDENGVFVPWEAGYKCECGMDSLPESERGKHSSWCPKASTYDQP